MKGWSILLVGAFLAALVVALVFWNGQAVTVNLLLAEWPTTLGGALIVSVIVGAMIGTIAFAWPMVRLKMEARRQIKRISELEQEIHGLRTLPIASDTAGASSAPKV